MSVVSGQTTPFAEAPGRATLSTSVSDFLNAAKLVGLRWYFRDRRPCAGWGWLAVLLLGVGSASAAVTEVKLAKDETVAVAGHMVRHLAGVIVGAADRNEPGVPTLDRIVGLKYESDFELWLPAGGGNGRLWFSVLNRGNDVGGLREGILGRGGVYGWCAWQAKHVAAGKPQLRLTGFEGPLPQAYGLVVVREFITFLRSSPGAGGVANPLADKVRFTFAYGLSQSARLLRTFLLHGLNTAPSGKVFDGVLADGGRAGYLDVFRADSDPGSGGTFSAETVYPPHSWAELLARSGTDAKVVALNAESEFFEMMAYLTHHGAVPGNVRVYDFPLGGHGGGGAVPWRACVLPLSAVLEDWACAATPPPDNRLLTLEQREHPRVKHLSTVPAEVPVADELGIARGGVRLPPVEVPTVRYVSNAGEAPQAVPLDNSELSHRYGTPENYRRRVAEVVERLVQERFLSAAAGAQYVADAEQVAW